MVLQTPECLYRAYNLFSPLVFKGPDLSEGPDSPEPQAQSPASTAPVRIEGEGAWKRRRMRKKLYRDSQYDLQLAETGNSEYEL